MDALDPERMPRNTAHHGPFTVRDEPSSGRVSGHCRVAQNLQALVRGEVSPNRNVLGVERIDPNDPLSELHASQSNSQLSQERIAFGLVAFLTRLPDRVCVSKTLPSG